MVFIVFQVVLVGFLALVLKTRGHQFRKDRENRHNRTSDSLLLSCLYETNLADTVWGSERLSLVTTRTTHPFVMAILHSSKDKAVSEKIKNEGLWDPQILGPMQFILEKSPCDGSSMVLDVGANIGFFGLFALSMSCDTIMFEPQKQTAAAIRASLCINEHVFRRKGLRAALIPKPVAMSSTVMFPTDYTLHGQNTGGVSRIDCSSKEAKCEEFAAVSLDDFVMGPMGKQMTQGKQRIRVMKVDVEGFEGDAFASMKGLLEKHLVDNILFELIPYIRGADEAKGIVRTLHEYGYSLAESPFAFLEGVRDVDRPYIKKVAPLKIDQACALIDDMTKTGNDPKARNNWRGPKHYTDMWATLTPTLFDDYNKAVIPGA